MAQDSSSLVGFLMPYMKGHRGLLTATFLSLIFATLSILAFGFGVRLLIDGGFSVSPVGSFWDSFAILCAATLTLSAASYGRTLSSAILADRVIFSLRQDLFDRLLTLDASFFDRQKTGDLLSLIQTDTMIVRTVISGGVPVALRSVLQCFGAGILMIMTSPTLAAWAFTLIPLVLSPLAFFIKHLKSGSARYLAHMGEIGAHLEESLFARTAIQSNNQEQRQKDHLRLLHDCALTAAKKRSQTRSAIIAFVIVGVFLAIAWIVFKGAGQVATGTITGGTLASFLFYAIVAAGSLNSISEPMTDFQNAAASVPRFQSVLGAKSALTEPCPRKAKKLPKPFVGSLVFDDVSFSYPRAPERLVLRHFSAHIEPGECAALVGPSGAGKSTLFQLLLRFYDPQNGTISLHGHPLQHLLLHDVRASFALVPQDPPIFHGTLAHNIAFARPDATHNQMNAAIKAAYLQDFIKTLPDGLDTEVGEKGLRLSGGQKQRVAIARALLKDAPILLLDEATSALDSESEWAIEQALKTLMTDRTSIMIAHRLTTVRRANRLLVIDNGVLVESGTHDTLMTTNGLYSRLASKQFFGHPNQKDPIP